MALCFCGCGVTTSLMGGLFGGIVLGKGIENHNASIVVPEPKPIPKPAVVEKKVTIILLENDDGSVGQITVANDAGRQVIDQPNHYTVIKNIKTAPAKPVVAPKEMMEKRFKSILTAQPLKPVSFLFYFEKGESSISVASAQLIPDVIRAVQKRMPAEIQIIGHADRAGNDEYNVKLSLERATSVLKILKMKGVVDAVYTVSSHGENDPLVETADGVAEAKNRRVEVIVR